MSDNLNNKLDFYRNQIPQNPNNQANILMRQDRREVSFAVDPNFLQSSLYLFLQENFKKIQNIEHNNQKIEQMFEVFRIMGQEINNLKDNLTKAFQVQENKINNINQDNNKVNQKCYDFYKAWLDEDSKNKESINKVHEVLNENNNKIANEINCQSKKLDESIQKNKIDNEKIKNDFEILKSNLNLAQNKNDGHEKIIKNLQETCNSNYKKIIELETKLLNLENNYKNNKDITEIKSKIENNSNNISNFENKFKKNKNEIDNKIKDMKEKIEEMNEQTIKKFDEITQAINKMKSDVINKKIESIKIKDDKSNNKVLEGLKEQINEFIDNNNKEVNEIKNKHKKDIDDLNKKIKEDLDKLNNECDNKIDDNLNKFKINFEKIEKDFKNQNEIN